ncbi:phosphatidylinositol kinase [Desulfovibrio psychrotolerans]|uniref:Phosphatidylinositol kinase n=2 Tax=Desulfovibrio psychrotolerans TaxID=415242 RepID=A0A7J0BY37_9BACT|nr:phosphatidylinositol kinase [Desulfovibrio psychrotolerans]
MLKFSLEPYLKVGEGTFASPQGKALFGSIGDSAPDRWGRVLMERREARQARLENRAPRHLLDSDYLLLVSDTARQGALRFSLTKEGPFLASDADTAIPPIINLGRLLEASTRVLNRQEVDEDIRDLVNPGASLGGARPKASVFGTDGRLRIAKFSSPHDRWNVVVWEYVCLQMAAQAGITTSGHRLEKVGEANVLILERFDRTGGGHRIPYLSAMSMLNYSDGEHGSYLELAEILRENGAAAEADLKELWRRLVFNIMVSNVDDHLRNHGFLYAGSDGWRLSPVFDLEATPTSEKARTLHTTIDMYDGTASLELALEVAQDFGLDLNTARGIAKEVAKATSRWNVLASRCGITPNEIEFMRSAFVHDDLRLGLAGGKSSPAPCSTPPAV